MLSPSALIDNPASLVPFTFSNEMAPELFTFNPLPSVVTTEAVVSVAVMVEPSVTPSVAELFDKFILPLLPEIDVEVEPMIVFVAPVTVFVEVPALPIVLLEPEPLPKVLVVLAPVANVVLPVDDKVPVTAVPISLTTSWLAAELWSVTFPPEVLPIVVEAEPVVLIFVVPVNVLVPLLVTIELVPEAKVTALVLPDAPIVVAAEPVVLMLVAPVRLVEPV